MAAADRDEALRAVLASVAPGTALRDGLERILRGNTGALIVCGWDATVESICTGGFPLDVEFSATRLRELAKMDGAVVLSTDGSRIVRAGTHLMPDAAIPTEESGTRHRTGQRVAVQTGYTVISVSQSMRTIRMYMGGSRFVVEGSAAVLSRANQALDTLERYKTRLDEVSNTLFALEIEDLVTVRDAAAVLQRLEMVLRIEDEISRYEVELGDDGRLLALERAEVMGGVRIDPDLLVRDYLPMGRRAVSADDAMGALDALDSTDLLDLVLLASALGFPATLDALDIAVSPRGYRMLSRVPRLPVTVLERVVEHFGSLQKLLAASADDLLQIDGVGDTRARAMRESLSRLADASIVDRYG